MSHLQPRVPPRPRTGARRRRPQPLRLSIGWSQSTATSLYPVCGRWVPLPNLRRSSPSVCPTPAPLSPEAPRGSADPVAAADSRGGGVAQRKPEGSGSWSGKMFSRYQRKGRQCSLRRSARRASRSPRWRKRAPPPTRLSASSSHTSATRRALRSSVSPAPVVTGFGIRAFRGSG